MMNKIVSLFVVLACLAVTPSLLVAQAPLPAQAEQPVQLMVDLGRGLVKVRESHRGLIGPVAIPVGQQVTVTLRFLPSLAGVPAFISSLDGGELNAPPTPTIGVDGTFKFQFRPDNASGSYRFVIRSLQEYAVTFYGFDP